MSKVININNKKLHKCVEHVQYEIDMFYYTCSVLSMGNLDQNQINAHLEVFALHARNLFYFFYTPKNKRIKNDIIAEDFLDQVKPFIQNRTPKKELSIIPKKAGKQVMHLTFSRINYNKRSKPWRCALILQRLNKTINEFYNALPHEKRDWFT